MESRRFHILDFSRLVAALMVVAFHCDVPFSRLNWIAVDFFFVLSGFVLAQKILSNRKKFIIGRLKRFYPISALSVITSVILSYFLKYFFNQDIKILNIYTSAIFAILLFQVFSSESLRWNPPLWSLSSEIIVNICICVFKPKKAVHIGLFLIFSYVLLILGILLTPKTYPFLNLGRGFLGFSMGMLIRKIYDRKKFENKLYLIFSTILFIGIAFFVARQLGKYSLLLLPAIFSIVVLSCASIDCEFRPRLISLCEMGGRFSFPIYVWHVPIQQITLPITQEISNNRNSIEFNLIFFITTLGFSIWASKISNYVVKNLLSKL